MIERYLGYCPVCDGDYKAPGGLLALHGYKRPGIGYIVGDCMGAGKQPHEVSNELARAYLDILKNIETNTQRALRELPTLIEIRVVSPYPNRPDKIYTPADGYDWKRALERRESELKYKLLGLRDELGRVQNLLDTWRPVPLRTVRESEEQNTRVRAERQQTVRAERASAIHNLPDKLRIGWGLPTMPTPSEAIAALERDHVWTAFGLPLQVPHWKSAERETIGQILRSMQYSEYDKQPMQWPAELGEPKKKRAKR